MKLFSSPVHVKTYSVVGEVTYTLGSSLSVLEQTVPQSMRTLLSLKGATCKIWVEFEGTSKNTLKYCERPDG